MSEFRDNWNVYFQSDFHGRCGRAGSRGKRGIEIRLDREFTWCGHRWIIPAVYLCGQGLVIDFCVESSQDAIRAFMSKWSDIITDSTCSIPAEDLERIESENPLDLQFRPCVVVNGRRLQDYHGHSAIYNPCIGDSHNGTDESTYAANHYGLNSSSAWTIWRYSFPWSTTRKPNVKSLSLSLSQTPVSIPGPVFTADIGKEIPFTRPSTNTDHVLKVLSLEPREIDKTFSIPCFEVPRNYISMTYSISPTLPEDAISVTDHFKGDNKRPVSYSQQSSSPSDTDRADSIGIIGGSDGPIAIIINEDHPENTHIAFSSLRFELQKNIEWLITFHEKECDDIILDLI